MKIDIMFLVSAHMGFGHCMKIFPNSLFLKERPGKIQIFCFIIIFPVKQLQLKIVVFPKKFPAKHGERG